MEEMQNQHSAKVSPIEVVIFLAITAISFYSAYRLMNESVELNPSTLQTASRDRSPAGQRSSLEMIKIGCNPSEHYKTSAAQIQLNGSLCGVNEKNLIKADIVNMSNQFHATVFSQSDSNQFSTDYIPLNAGENIIQTNFIDPNGKTFSQQIVIENQKDPQN